MNSGLSEGIPLAGISRPAYEVAIPAVHKNTHLHFHMWIYINKAQHKAGHLP